MKISSHLICKTEILHNFLIYIPLYRHVEERTNVQEHDDTGSWRGS